MNETGVALAAAPGEISLRPGRTLAEARAARSLTVAEIAQQLKLSTSQIEALEAEAYDRLPGPVFVRGFVRNYARLLELDADALAAAVDLPHAASPATAAVPLSRNIPFPEKRPAVWWPYVLGFGVVVLAVVLFEIFFSAPPTMVVSTVPPGEENRLVSVTPEPAVPAVSALPADEPPALQPEVLAEPAAPAVAAGGTDPAPAAQAAGAGMSDLHFAFEAVSWVEVRDGNNRPVFSQLNPAGSEQRIQGKPPLSVVVGNARAVRLTYNGRPFDLAPHTRVEVARFTLE